jgi:hypothetical protein
MIILFICVSLQAHRWTRVGNMSAMIGWLVGYIGLSIASDRQGVRPAIAMLISGLAKYISAIFLPLQIAARHWRTLIWTLAISAAFMLISLIFTGVAPYRTFATEIAPTLSRPVLRDQNVSLVAFAHRVLRVDPLPHAAQVGLKAAQLGLLILIIFALARKPFHDWRSPANACAACVALIGWLLIFSPILWEHYFAYLAPFYGWLIFEALHARGRAALLIGPTVAIALLLAWFPQKVFGSRHIAEPINSFLLWSVILMMIVALWRMFRRESGETVTRAASPC